jgi:hypothetical protein
MKTKFILFTIICLLTSIISFAQASEGIPYYSAARDASGHLLSNQPISLQFNIHTYSAAGTVAFSENQSVVTNTLGLFRVNVREGLANNGTLACVDLGSSIKFSEIEMDALGRASYTSLGRSQITSDPYTLFAGCSSDFSINLILI